MYTNVELTSLEESDFNLGQVLLTLVRLYIVYTITDYYSNIFVSCFHSNGLVKDIGATREWMGYFVIYSKLRLSKHSSSACGLEDSLVSYIHIIKPSKISQGLYRTASMDRLFNR